MVYSYDSERCIVRYVAPPHLSFVDRFVEIFEMTQDQTLPQSAGVFLDLGEADDMPTIEVVDRVPLLFAVLSARFGGKVAIFAPVVGHQSLYQLATVSTPSDRCRAFSDRTQALDWLAQKSDG